jgi:YD repeat-containing protein
VQTAELGADRADLWQMTSACRWNADRLTCTQQYSQFRGDCEGERGDAIWTATYGSAADFVDEVMTSPPVSKALTLAVTSTGGRCPSPFESRLQYDGSGRLQRITTGSAQNLAGNSTRTFTAWDPQGRPTDGTFTNFRVNGPLAIRHDEAARTTTEVATYDAGRWVVTTLTGYDANGIVVREVLSDAIPGEARPVYTTVTTVLATDRVCK